MMLDGYVFAFNQIETNIKWYTYFSRWEDNVFDFNEDLTFIGVAFFTYKPNTDKKKEATKNWYKLIIVYHGV